MNNSTFALSVERDGTSRARRARWLTIGALALALLPFTGEEIGATETTGSLTTARYSHVAVNLPDGRVLIAGGHTVEGSLSSMTASAEIYDPSTGQFSPTGSLAEARGQHAAATLSDGRVLVVGGLGLVAGNPANLASAEIYDPATGTWATTGPMNTARRAPIALALPDGRILIIGGDSTIAGAELFDPATGT